VSSFPLYRAAGDARELGRAHGAQAGPVIRRFVDYLAGSLELSIDALQERAGRFLPLFERYCPHLLPEIHGLAEGAVIHHDLALALQLRGELTGIADGACTTFAVGPRGTADGTTLIGQNSDTPAEIEEFGYVLRIVPDDRPSLLMWTFGGMIGYHGLNDRGVAHFANSLGGGPRWKFALSHYPLKRLLLECETMPRVRRMLREIPICSNGNYVVCADRAIVDVELTSDGPLFLEDSGKGFLAHSNHYLCAPHACPENFALSLPDSFARQETINLRLAERSGQLTIADMKRILSDHAGHPVGICRHPHAGFGNSLLPASGKTVASLIAQPERGLLHVARGNPCDNAYATYDLATTG
jgi:isopenicillin-N N-acyltransferase like protein